MKLSFLGSCVRFASESAGTRRLATTPVGLGQFFVAAKGLHSSRTAFPLCRRYLSSKSKDVSPVVRLDSQGGARLVYDNFGRLRVFIKFLVFQSVPLFIFAYCYKRFEKERQDLYSVPLESVDDALRHFFSVTRGAQCFLLLGNKSYMVNFSIGKNINFEGVDSLESFFNRFQPQYRELLQHICIAYPPNLGIEKAVSSENGARLLFYNQAIDSFAEVNVGGHFITDAEQKKQLWSPKLGSETNHLGVFSTNFIRIGFGGTDKIVELQKKEDWMLL
ncbi:indoleamine 2,3-dioxygenase 2 [Babesia ovis]|uniref:Indoleamine 2,3-dioxygenase 2 n=1 Tax=Babesia ovis TaxID=5869 RepID=A0A9W5TBF2_BABOV|nr:indoleamine 2,3-dioxygenase 2 [Babesia ovis]